MFHVQLRFVLIILGVFVCSSYLAYGESIDSVSSTETPSAISTNPDPITTSGKSTSIDPKPTTDTTPDESINNKPNLNAQPPPVENEEYEFSIEKFAQAIAYSIGGYIDFGFRISEHESDLGNPTFFLGESILILDVPIILDRLYIYSLLPLEFQKGTNDGFVFSSFVDFFGGKGRFFNSKALVELIFHKDSESFISYLSTYFGIIWVPFALESENAASHLNKLITRPRSFISGDTTLLTEGTNIFPGTFVDLGMVLSVKFKDIGHLELYIINGDVNTFGQLDNKVSVIDAVPQIKQDLLAAGIPEEFFEAGGLGSLTSKGNSQKSGGLRVQLNEIIKGLNLGGSFIYGHWAESLHAYRYAFHIDVSFKELFDISRNFVLRAEFVKGEDEGVPFFFQLPPFPINDQNVWGWYVLGSAELIKKIEFVARVGQSDADTKFPKEKQFKILEISAGLLIHIMTNALLKLEYQWILEDGVMDKIKNNLFAVNFVTFW